MAKWILTIFVISPLSSSSISKYRTDLIYYWLYAIFEIIVTRIFSPNSNLSFSSSLVSSCTPLLTMASYQETKDDQDGEYFFLNDHPLLFSHQARPGPAKNLILLWFDQHWDPAGWPELGWKPGRPRPCDEMRDERWESLNLFPPIVVYWQCAACHTAAPLLHSYLIYHLSNSSYLTSSLSSSPSTSLLRTTPCPLVSVVF